jgi:hypothetical protein
LLDNSELVWSYLHNEQARRDNATAFLAAWFRHLRVHQAIKRGLAENPLARSVPVIVGTNEVAPYFKAIYYPAATADYRAAAAERQAEKRAAARMDYDRFTEDQIARWRDHREAIRDWDPRVGPDRRQTYIAYVEATEECERAYCPPLEGFGPSHALSPGEFERMVETYRQYRDPNYAPAASPPPPPAPVSLPRAAPILPRRTVGFGRKGL